MNSGGTVTRDMIGTPSYLVLFLLRILESAQHLGFAPPSVLTRPIPPVGLTLLFQTTSQVPEVQLARNIRGSVCLQEVLSLGGLPDHKAEVTTKYETDGIKECLWNSG